MTNNNQNNDGSTQQLHPFQSSTALMEPFNGGTESPPMASFVTRGSLTNPPLTIETVDDNNLINDDIVDLHQHQNQQRQNRQQQQQQLYNSNRKQYPSATSSMESSDQGDNNSLAKNKLDAQQNYNNNNFRGSSQSGNDETYPEQGEMNVKQSKLNRNNRKQWDNNGISDKQTNDKITASKVDELNKLVHELKQRMENDNSQANGRVNDDSYNSNNDNNNNHNNNSNNNSPIARDKNQKLPSVPNDVTGDLIDLIAAKTAAKVAEKQVTTSVNKNNNNNNKSSEAIDEGEEDLADIDDDDSDVDEYDKQQRRLNKEKDKLSKRKRNKNHARQVMASSEINNKKMVEKRDNNNNNKNTNVNNGNDNINSNGNYVNNNRNDKYKGASSYNENKIKQLINMEKEADNSDSTTINNRDNNNNNDNSDDQYSKSDRQRDKGLMRQELDRSRSATADTRKRLPIKVKSLIEEALSKDGQNGQADKTKQQSSFGELANHGKQQSIEGDDTNKDNNKKITMSGGSQAHLTDEYPISDKVGARLNKLSQDLDHYFNDGFLDEPMEKGDEARRELASDTKPTATATTYDNDANWQNASPYKRPSTTSLANKGLINTAPVSSKQQSHMKQDGLKLTIGNDNENFGTIDDATNNDDTDNNNDGGVRGEDNNYEENKASTKAKTKANRKRRPPLRNKKRRQLAPSRARRGQDASYRNDNGNEKVATSSSLEDEVEPEGEQDSDDEPEENGISGQEVKRARMKPVNKRLSAKTSERLIQTEESPNSNRFKFFGFEPEANGSRQRKRLTNTKSRPLEMDPVDSETMDTPIGSFDSTGSGRDDHDDDDGRQARKKLIYEKTRQIRKSGKNGQDLEDAMDSIVEPDTLYDQGTDQHNSVTLINNKQQLDDRNRLKERRLPSSSSKSSSGYKVVPNKSQTNSIKCAKTKQLSSTNKKRPANQLNNVARNNKEIDSLDHVDTVKTAYPNKKLRQKRKKWSHKPHSLRVKKLSGSKDIRSQKEAQHELNSYPTLQNGASRLGETENDDEQNVKLFPFNITLDAKPQQTTTIVPDSGKVYNTTAGDKETDNLIKNTQTVIDYGHRPQEEKDQTLKARPVGQLVKDDKLNQNLFNSSYLSPQLTAHEKLSAPLNQIKTHPTIDINERVNFDDQEDDEVYQQREPQRIS